MYYGLWSMYYGLWAMYNGLCTIDYFYVKWDMVIIWNAGMQGVGHGAGSREKAFLLPSLTTIVPPYCRTAVPFLTSLC